MPNLITGLHRFLRQLIGMLEISGALGIYPVRGSIRRSPGSHVI